MDTLSILQLLRQTMNLIHHGYKHLLYRGTEILMNICWHNTSILCHIILWESSCHVKLHPGWTKIMEINLILSGHGFECLTGLPRFSVDKQKYTLCWCSRLNNVSAITGTGLILWAWLLLEISLRKWILYNLSYHYLLSNKNWNIYFLFAFLLTIVNIINWHFTYLYIIR